MRKSALMITIMLMTTLVLGLLGTRAVAAPPAAFPKLIQLPNGFHPEGIVVGNGTNFYVGSLFQGAIYRGDLRTGQGQILVPPQEGRVAVGLAFDPRSNLLFVAGGPTGAAYVYNAATGETVAVYQLTGSGSFVNDVIVTRKAAYFTDSFRPFLYRLPLGPAGALADPAAVEELALGAEFDFVPGAFNANGIEATPNGKFLVVANSQAGKLYRVDPGTGQATTIDLGGGAVPSADGLVLDGKRLYVVQNVLNQIAVVELAPDLSSGTVARTITDPEFKIPTTAANFGQALYAVNARFDVAPPPFFGTPPSPGVEFQVVQVSKR